MLQPWKTARVINITNATPITKSFFLEMEEEVEFAFLPGQFITLDLPIHEQKNKRWRSYSIASAPDNTKIIELIIVLAEGGVGTKYLFEEVEIGSTLTYRGPLGKFTMPSILDKDLYLICTGTGIAPFRSMVSFIHTNKIPHKNIYLIFGCRKFEDGLYINELKALEQKENGFYFIPTYSRETAVDKTSAIGYVHGVYEKLISNNNSAPAYFYLCGWKNMVDEAKENIKQLGYDKACIHLELYG